MRVKILFLAVFAVAGFAAAALLAHSGANARSFGGVVRIQRSQHATTCTGAPEIIDFHFERFFDFDPQRLMGPSLLITALFGGTIDAKGAQQQSWWIWVRSDWGPWGGTTPPHGTGTITFSGVGGGASWFAAGATYNYTLNVQTDCGTAQRTVAVVWPDHADPIPTSTYWTYTYTPAPQPATTPPPTVAPPPTTTVAAPPSTTPPPTVAPPPTSPARPTESLTKYAGYIVQWDGDHKAQKTSWLVGPDLKRRWIRDIPAYNCSIAQGREKWPTALSSLILDRLDRSDRYIGHVRLRRTRRLIFVW